MAIPGSNEILLAFLKIASDGKERQIQDMIQAIADYYQLSERDREELIPSGHRRKLNHRVGWARTRLKQAGLICYVRHGVHQITDLGRELLEKSPEQITLRMLSAYSGETTIESTSSTSQDNGSSTPEEEIAQLVAYLQSQLADELLDRLRDINPYQFEQVVIDLLFAMGYGGSRKEAASVTKKSNDEGIDGVINEDRLGLDVIYVQAKRYQANIGRKEIQAFVGALAGKQANKGVFITTSDFVSTATEYANAVAQKVVLIDGKKLAQLMVEHNIGVSVAQSYAMKKIDSDYFDEA